jgi:hypothetical protein
MVFILLGFSQEDNIRHYSFERIAADGKRTEFTVHADLPLARKFNIKLQELPLMCRQILAAQPEGEDENVIVTADHLRLHLEGVAASIVQPTKRGRKAQPLMTSTMSATLEPYV